MDNESSGGDAFARPLSSARKKLRARGSEVLGKLHSRVKLFHYDLSLKALSICVASNIVVIYRLVLPSYFSLFSLSVINCVDDCVFGIFLKYERSPPDCVITSLT